MQRLGWFAVALLCVASLPGAAHAQKDEGDKTFEKSIDETLRKVIDLGADIYNKQSDYNGCFRLYEGALLTLKPVLTKYPDLQKAIDSGVNNAYTLTRVDERAHALRAVLGTIRMTFNPNLRPADDKKAEDKKTEVDRKDARARELLPDPALAQVNGKVMLKGQPVMGGHVTFVGADGGRSSAKIQKDGTYQLGTGIPPGQYKVFLEPPTAAGAKEAIPQKYLAPDTTPLRVTAVKGGQTYDINLVGD
jgi:hypothetical protein